MLTKTIELLLDLEASKTPSVDQLKKDLEFLDKTAKKLKKDLGEALEKGDKNAAELARELAHTENLMKQVDAEAKKQVLAKSLKAAADQANRTRERMEKIVQVGTRIATAGALLVAPFALAVNKYIDAQKEIEANGGKMDESARRMIALQERWAASQERIGKVATEVLLPYLERALDLVDKIAAFAEQHPDAVKAALAIGGSMVVIGGALSAAGSIMGTIATLQGLLTGAGLAGGGAAGAGLAGLGTSIAAAISAAAPFVAIAAAVALAAEATRQFLNWALGTNTTWSDIGTTVKQLFYIAGAGWKSLPQQLTQIYGSIFENGVQIVEKLSVIIMTGIGNAITAVGKFFYELITSAYSIGTNIVNGIGQYLYNLGASIIGGLVGLGNAIMTGISNLINGIIPGRATGGYASGIIRTGERGREFVLSNRTTRAAESIIGGTLTQQRFLQALAGGRNANVYQSMRFSGEIGAGDKREVRRIARDAALNGIAEAFR